MKVIKRILTDILGKSEEFSFENHVLLSTALYSCILCLISIFADIIAKLGLLTTIVASISSIVYGIVYISGFWFKRISFSKNLFSIYSLLFCNLYWICNYGSRGSGLYFFVVFYTLLIFIWDNVQIRLITFITIANIVVLFALELIEHDIIPIYPNEVSRISDSYISLLMIIGFFSIIIVSAKNNYIKQYKMAQRSDMLKSAFLANMSHEIRTPLNAIMGFTRLFTTRELTKEKKVQYSELITSNSKYLMQLLSDILDISMIESGQLKINASKIELKGFIDKIHSTNLHAFKELNKSNINFYIDMPLDEQVIISDVTRLEQIMNNLIGNAIKFTSEGYIKIGYYLQGGDYVFFVEDTGRGIKEEFQPEIFNRFVKNEDGSEAQFARGAGIGLSLTRDLVKALGGKIWFSSV